MAKKSSLFDDLFNIVSRLPWWVSLIIAVGSGIYLHSVASTPITTSADVHHLQSVMLSSVAHTAATFGQYLLPMIFGLGAIASLWDKHKRRNPPRAVGAELKRRTAETKPPEPQPSAERVALRIGPTMTEPGVATPKKAKPLRKSPSPASPATPTPPACPHCRKPMVVRIARSGADAGGNFWGCADYPKCRGMRRFNRASNPLIATTRVPPRNDTL